MFRYRGPGLRDRVSALATATTVPATATTPATATATAATVPATVTTPASGGTGQLHGAT